MNSTSGFFTTPDTLPNMNQSGLNSLPTSWFSNEANWTSTEANWTSTEANWTLTEVNWTTAEPPESYTVSAAVLYLFFAIRIIWGLLTIIGNGMTIFIVARYEIFHTCSNYLICSLAVADLLSVPTIPLNIILETYADTEYYVPACLMEQVANVLTTAGSLVNIMYISIDRYIYIAFPLRYQSLITSSKTLTLIGVTWVYYLVSTPLTIYLGSRLTIGMPCKFSVYLHPSLYKLYMTPQFFIFLFLTIGFNVAIAKIAHKQSRAIAVAQQPYNTVEASRSRRSRKISRMLGTVLGVYILCIIPQYMVNLLIHRGATKALLTAEKFTLLVWWAATWANPLIYVWRLKQFRVAFKKVLTGRGNLNDISDP